MRLHFCFSACLLAAALWFFGPPVARAGEPAGAYSFRNYGPEQGLRNQAVTGLAQDRDGFIFAATEDGLFRYDGNRFERFGTSEGLASNSIIALYQEPSGRIWVMNAKGALAWRGNRPDPSVKARILPDERIESIAATGAGDLLVVTAQGIYQGKPDGLARVTGLPKAETGAVWLAQDGSEAMVALGGKLYRRRANGAWEARELPPDYKNELIHAILKDAKGRIWIRGRRVLLRLASFDGEGEDLSGKLPGASVQKGQLLTDPAGRVWTPTNLGLVRFDEQGVWTLSEKEGLPSQWVTSMLFDHEGSLWIASEGVQRLQGRLAWSAHTKRQNVPSDTVWSVYRSRDGVLWIGTNRGMARATEKGWLLYPGTEERSVYAFTEDAEGNLWAAGNNAKATRNALLLRAAGSAAFRHVPLDHLDGPSTVNSMAQGSDGALYLGTQAHGMQRMLRSGSGYKGEAVRLPKGNEKEQINQLVPDAKRRLWVAGMEGLAYFDGSAWRRFGTEHGLREAHVEAIVIEPSGNLLVSYWNVHGLTRLKVNDQGVVGATQVDQPAGMVSDNIYSLGYDVHGALWLGTAQGVKRFKDGRLEQFGRGEGLPGDDAAANAFWSDPNGDAWIGMASGLAHYRAFDAPPAPPLAATRVLRVADGSGASLAGERPVVAWKDRTLTFRFAVLSYVNESRVRIQVRLVGFEDEWRDTDIHEARYTSLPAGNYRFEVRAAAGTAGFGAPAVRDVVVAPPWWMTGWAIALFVLLAAALLALLLRWRTGRLQRRNADLEALVSARTRDLEKANEALQEASMIDPLTGLKNRRFLGLSMPDELARVTRQYRTADYTRSEVNKTLMIFMVDIDHFKAVNDTHGHAAGDLVLQQASLALRRACRDADFVVRWGGEEFLIVARNADRHCAQLMANNLLNAVRELRIDVGNGVVLEKTCSLGFSAYPVIESDPEAHSWEEAVKIADQCLYAAKHSGRDGWVGVVISDGDPDAPARVDGDLSLMVDQGKVRPMQSFPPATTLRWH